MNKNEVIKTIIKLGCVLACSFAPVLGQDFNPLAPKTPASQAPAPGLKGNPPPEPGAESGGELVIPFNMNGLVIVKSIEEVKLEGLTGIRGLDVRGPDFLKDPALERIVAPYLGQPLRMTNLAKLQRDIILFCRKRNHLVVDVFFPSGQQVLDDGVVQMAVIEGKLGKVNVVDANKAFTFTNEMEKLQIAYSPYTNGWFKEKLIRRNLQLKPGDSILESKLLKDINWLNRNPYFRQVDVAFKQGKLGEADLDLRVKDGKSRLHPFPMRLYGGVEDSGNKLVGDYRLLGGLNWGNVLGLDHQLNYQFATDLDHKFLKAHSASYVAPLPWRHTLTLFGYYADMKANLAAIKLPEFEQQGQSYQASARYSVPLPELGKYGHELSLGFDYKRTDNNIEFGGSSVFDTPTSVLQGMGGYRGTLPDPLGATSAGVQGFYSPGDLSDFNKTINYSKTRPGAVANYYYIRLNGERVTKLPVVHGWLEKPVDKNFSWAVRGVWQFSDENLLGSEQLGLGGYETVRGYDERVANGDQGFIINNELLFPTLEWKTGGRGPMKLQFLGFCDYGSTRLNKLFAGDDPHADLYSAGGGLRLALSRNLLVRFDYGFQLKLDDTIRRVQGANQYTSRAHFSAVLSF
ncbi:MAG: ShlB/FhaC/HecB family hemolysin secretion/activation protein [Bacteroidota bacterium]